ncbi:hypothetical protein FORC066_0872 [Yersinia enterocolitica]|nr:hypothetical protein FORC066_0872 [Yersinia enterocolitica]
MAARQILSKLTRSVSLPRQSAQSRNFAENINLSLKYKTPLVL